MEENGERLSKRPKLLHGLFNTKKTSVEVNPVSIHPHNPHSIPESNPEAAAQAAWDNEARPSGQLTQSEPHATLQKWPGLKQFQRVLNKTADVFGPLKSAVDGITCFIELIEREAEDRDEYRRLCAELESLFDDLSRCFDRDIPPAMADAITGVTKSIARELGRIGEVQTKSKINRVAAANSDGDTILKCYRQIQVSLGQLMVKADMNLWRIVDEQTTNMRLRNLPSSPAAMYRSADADGIGRRACTANTRAEVLQQLHDWTYGDQAHRIYWLNGMAGTGKTTIAFSTCLQLERSRKLAASFFCSRQLPDCRDVKKIIPTIAYQLALFSRPFRRALSEVLGENPEAHNQSLEKQFEDLMAVPLKEVEADFPCDRVIVIDALDECHDEDSVDRLLEAIFTHGLELPVKFLVTSRPEPKILDRMRHPGNSCMRDEMRLHELGRTIVQEDIRTYLTTELTNISISTSELDQLDNFSMSTRRLSEVLDMSASTNDTHGEIDVIYTAVLRSAFESRRYTNKDRDCMTTLLYTIICAQEPLALDTIAELTGLDLQNVLRPALRPLMSVLYLAEKTNIVTTLHESFPDYMLSEQRSGKFWCSPQIHHVRMAAMCFDAIDKPDPPFNICRLESSYIFDRDVPDLETKVKNAISNALHYACRYWCAHLIRGISSEHLLGRLESFLSTRLLLWLEIINLKNFISDGMKSLQSCAKIPDCSMQTRELIRDTVDFTTILAFNNVLQSTPHIYISGLALWPKDRPIRKRYAQHFSGLIDIKGTALNQRIHKIAVIDTDSDVICLVYSPDGAHLASGHENGTICMWDAYTGQPVGQPLKRHTGQVNSVVYSPNGKIIVSGSNDGTICVWNARTGQQVGQPMLGHTDAVLSVAYSPDESRIASGSSDGTIRIWNTDITQGNGEILANNCNTVTSVAYSRDGALIATGSDAQVVRLWETRTGQEIAEPIDMKLWIQKRLDPSRPFLVLFSPANALIAPNGEYIAKWDAAVILQGISLDNQSDWLYDSVLGIREPPGRVDSIIYSPHGKHIAGGTFIEGYSITIWDGFSGEEVGPLDWGERTRPISALAYSPDSSRLASNDVTKSHINIWNTQLIVEKTPLDPYIGYLNSMACSPDGAFLARSYSFRSGLCINSTKNWENTAQIVADVRTFAWSPNSRYIAYTAGFGDRETLHIWDVHTSQQICQSPVYLPGYFRVAPDFLDEIIRNYPVYDNQVISLPLERHKYSLMSVSGPEMDHLNEFVGWFDDVTVHAWSAYPPKDVVPLTGHTGWVSSAAYSPCCTRIITVSDGVTIRIWDALTGQQIGQLLTGHTEKVMSVACSPDGSLFASGSWDKTVRLWDAYSGKPIGEPFTEHREAVREIIFLPCGSCVASRSCDGEVRVWSIATRPVTSPYHPCDHAPVTMDQLLETLSNYVQGGGLNTDQKIKQSSRDDWELCDDGWIRYDGDLLIWVPPELRAQLFRPRTHAIISHKGWLKLEYSDANLGERWAECYQPRTSR